MGDMTELAPSLVELARRFGIATEYTDWTGRQVLVSEATLVAALAALGVPAQTEQQRNDALAAQLRSYWARPLPATIVMRAGEQTQFRVHVTDGAPADVWLQLEDGTTRAEVVQVDNFTPPFDLDGRWIGEASFVLPADLPLGYHRVNLRSDAAHRPRRSADAARGHLHRSQGSHLGRGGARCDDLTDELLVSFRWPAARLHPELATGRSR